MPVLAVDIFSPNDDLTYGATANDVRPLLPHRRWTPGTKPDLEDVGSFIESQASVLEVDVAGLLLADPRPITDDQAGRVVALARRAVILGAAAQADAAGAPERARANDPSNYSGWLLERYQEAVDRLYAYVEGLEAGTTDTGGEADSEPAWSFPDPVGWAARGI